MKKILFFLASGLAFAPSLAFAQTTVATYLTAFADFLTNKIIPAIVAIAVLFLIWGVTKYFIMGATNEESREKGRQLVLWGILALALILSLWGITNSLITAFGIGTTTVTCPDYNPGCDGGSNSAVSPSTGSPTPISTFSTTNTTSGGNPLSTGGGSSGNTGGTSPDPTTNASPQQSSSMNDAKPNTPVILTSLPAGAHCQDGIDNLKDLALHGNHEELYSYCKDYSGVYTWTNITASANVGSVYPDQQKFNDVTSVPGASCTMLHDHPIQTAIDWGMPSDPSQPYANGEQASAGDLAAMCTDVESEIYTQAIPSLAGIWNLSRYNYCQDSDYETIATMEALYALNNDGTIAESDKENAANKYLVSVSAVNRILETLPLSTVTPDNYWTVQQHMQVSLARSAGFQLDLALWQNGATNDFCSAHTPSI